MKIKLLAFLAVCSLLTACQSKDPIKSVNNISSGVPISSTNSSVNIEPESEPNPLETLVWKEKLTIGTKTFVATSVAIVREKPDPAAPEKLSLKKGAEINVIAITDNGYYKLDDGTFVTKGLFEEKSSLNALDDTSSTSSKVDQPSIQTSDISSSAPTEPVNLDVKYQTIVDEYTAKIIAATPQAIDEYNIEALKNTEGTLGLYMLVGKKMEKLATIYNEGGTKIIDISFSFGSGQYSEYEAWIDKLKLVYMKEASKIQDADKAFQQSINYYGEFGG